MREDSKLSFRSLHLSSLLPVCVDSKSMYDLPTIIQLIRLNVDKPVMLKERVVLFMEESRGGIACLVSGNPNERRL